MYIFHLITKSDLKKKKSNLSEQMREMSPSCICHCLHPPLPCQLLLLGVKKKSLSSPLEKKISPPYKRHLIDTQRDLVQD